ncbi:hypothetical protein cyc_04296 [Cyclospora cayetanensis]|uniref:Uncharacterized protein n=1 Tax=Cyclospora cayetanensis TaxID=88456 RepID=A0A1D3CT21_9EIME|nr:hypothetical protein cyc_04296 [Cyclospora cayetanensis]
MGATNYRVQGLRPLEERAMQRMKNRSDLLPSQQKVVALPHSRTIKVKPGDILVFACDGVFEAQGMTWKFVANYVAMQLQASIGPPSATVQRWRAATGGDLEETATRLVTTAYLMGSWDNISAMIVKVLPTALPSTVVTAAETDVLGFLARRVEKQCSEMARLSLRRSSSLVEVLQVVSNAVAEGSSSFARETTASPRRGKLCGKLLIPQTLGDSFGCSRRDALLLACVLSRLPARFDPPLLIVRPSWRLRGALLPKKPRFFGLLRDGDSAALSPSVEALAGALVDGSSDIGTSPDADSPPDFGFFLPNGKRILRELDIFLLLLLGPLLAAVPTLLLLASSSELSPSSPLSTSMEACLVGPFSPFLNHGNGLFSPFMRLLRFCLPLLPDVAPVSPVSEASPTDEASSSELCPSSALSTPVEVCLVDPLLPFLNGNGLFSFFSQPLPDRRPLPLDLALAPPPSGGPPTDEASFSDSLPLETASEVLATAELSVGDGAPPAAAPSPVGLASRSEASSRATVSPTAPQGVSLKPLSMAMPTSAVFRIHRKENPMTYAAPPFLFESEFLDMPLQSQPERPQGRIPQKPELKSCRRWGLNAFFLSRGIIHRNVLDGVVPLQRSF